MSEIVESGQPEEQAQETAPTSKGTESPASQPQDVVSRAEFESLLKQVRGIQSVNDKNKTNLDKAWEQLESLQLSKEQQAELSQRLRAEEQSETQEPVAKPQFDEERLVQRVVAALQEQPTGASIATPRGSLPPSEQLTPAQAKEALAVLQQAKPRSQRTPAEQERANELLDIIAQEDNIRG